MNHVANGKLKYINFNNGEIHVYISKNEKLHILSWVETTMIN